MCSGITVGPKMISICLRFMENWWGKGYVSQMLGPIGTINMAGQCLSIHKWLFALWFDFFLWDRDGETCQGSKGLSVVFSLTFILI